VSYVRTLMLDHLRDGFAEPVAGNPSRGWRLTAAGHKQFKAGLKVARWKTLQRLPAGGATSSIHA
jgi:hypothetical protein